MTIKAHTNFSFSTPDEVAECFPIDMDDPLYRRLWSMTEFYDNKFREEPDPEANSLASFWDKFTDEEKVKLNAAAEEHDKEWGF